MYSTLDLNCTFYKHLSIYFNQKAVFNTKSFMMVKTVDAIKVRNLMSRDVVDANLTKSIIMSMDDLIMYC